MEKQEKDSLFKKLFYTGVGLTISTKEKLEKKINELVDKNKITAEEGKKIIDDFVADFDSKKENLEKELKTFVKKTTESMKFAKKSDLDKLNKKLEEIESKLEKLGFDKKNEQ
jgi:polyhydroxyalkanoate synthesis regulator phasin